MKPVFRQFLINHTSSTIHKNTVRRLPKQCRPNSSDTVSYSDFWENITDFVKNLEFGLCEICFPDS